MAETAPAAPAIWWVRRDLRLADNPALLAASDGEVTVGPGTRPVLAVFVVDDTLMAPAGGPRREYLMTSLARLDASIDGSLLVTNGSPERVLPRLAREIGAVEVHVAADYGPYGRQRDERVEEALGDVPLVRTGSPYAVAPGRVRKGDGEPYRVFTPFSRAWREHGWRAPAPDADGVAWVDPDGLAPGGPGNLARTELPSPEDGHPRAGEAAALARWAEFGDLLAEYGTDRDRPDRAGTSHLSAP
ncbi:deoxyribodipyrimidine photo-lyase [Serinibacter arcticus]|uniref:deoxyribodipyrimidine photo-lyase n=1 Tax=Serinibacter arcticus TaxID=1655435 RepID=UPI0026793EA6